MKNKKAMISWIMLIVWMSFIFYMSNQTGTVSSSQSGKVVEILRALGLDFSNNAIDFITFIVRKTAHFTEYFILYLLSYNAINQHKQIKNTKVAALIILILYAASDEIHQYFVPGRSMALKDVIIDTLGGICAMIILCIIQKIMKNRKAKLKKQKMAENIN